MERAGRMLALRPRTIKEMRDRLTEAEIPDDVVEETVTRLVELQLVDDKDFATDWIEERSRRKGLGPRALMAELAAKGIERSLVEEVLAELGHDEVAQAKAEAEKHLRKVLRFPLKQQGAKLQQILVRKGFSYEAASEGARSVLPPEGWD
ncbi:MAG: regulatory protein RecX [Actinomycetota bacterium]